MAKQSEKNMADGNTADVSNTSASKKRGRPTRAENGTSVSKVPETQEKHSKRAEQPEKAASRKLRPQEDSELFALDIGTRTVVGIIGHMDDNIFCVDYAESVPHKRRAMIDGQIEDIPVVASVVKQVREKLEAKSGIKLSKVGIAAAGRALKTHRTELSFDVKDKDSISEDDVKSFELETTLKAQDELDTEIADAKMSFYCVGHTVVQYLLDDYKIGSLVGHKGKKVSVELIAAFLPSPVVESLYAVTDMNNLEVSSLTLEPIAAMNIVIPPEIRLINVALVDIGAGTSDIAIARNGSIVAYAMSTTAGDEITEEIIKKYLVDFSTAEEMKLSSYLEKIDYTDILGYKHTIEREEFFASLFPVVDSLADDIVKNIISANGQAPAAVFLVGGGSLIPDLSKYIAEKLDIPENRVAVGKNEVMKNVSFGNSKISGPEYVTPIGIGVTAIYNSGYDFSVVTLNDKKMRVFDTRAVRVLDLLTSAGYRSTQIIGRSGRNLNFTLNGEKQILKGGHSTVAEITLNGETVSLETIVNQGDKLVFKPAENGNNAEVKITDVAGDVSPHKVFVDGTEYLFGVIAHVNDKLVSGDYRIQNLDDVTVSEVETLGDLMQTLPFDTSTLNFYKSGKQLTVDYYLNDGDDIITSDKTIDSESRAGRLAKAIAEGLSSDNVAEAETEADEKATVTETEVAVEPAAEEAVQPQVSVESVQENVQESEPQAVVTETPAAEVPEAPSVPAVPVEKVPEEPVQPAQTAQDEFKVTLNGKVITLESRPATMPHEFIELMALADIDLDNPPADGNMILTLNGKDVSFMDVIHNGDVAVIRWANK
ncbi:MAG: pilus assembly protein PilM [Oscillospiraceae bacterium]|nr:pilus assembly protein PilM [Oscillospiraceae bacterium]